MSETDTDEKYVTTKLSTATCYHTDPKCRAIRANKCDLRKATENAIAFHELDECAACSGAERGLSDAEVREIRRRFEAGDTTSTLAGEFECSTRTIRRTVHGDYYGDVDFPPYDEAEVAP